MLREYLRGRCRTADELAPHPTSLRGGYGKCSVGEPGTADTRIPGEALCLIETSRVPRSRLESRLLKLKLFALLPGLSISRLVVGERGIYPFL